MVTDLHLPTIYFSCSFQPAWLHWLHLLTGRSVHYSWLVPSSKTLPASQGLYLGWSGMGEAGLEEWFLLFWISLWSLTFIVTILISLSIVGPWEEVSSRLLAPHPFLVLLVLLPHIAFIQFPGLQHYLMLPSHQFGVVYILAVFLVKSCLLFLTKLLPQAAAISLYLLYWNWIALGTNTPNHLLVVNSEASPLPRITNINYHFWNTDSSSSPVLLPWFSLATSWKHRVWVLAIVQFLFNLIQYQHSPSSVACQQQSASLVSAKFMQTEPN